jgi:hypothetical protein
MSVGASCSCNKQQQATTTLPIMMGAIKAITYCDGHDQCLHCEVPKRSQDEPLRRNEEGRDNQPQSHKVALPTNTTRASRERCKYQVDTHTTPTIIAARVSITRMDAQRT